MKKIIFFLVVTATSFSVNAQVKDTAPTVNNCPPCPKISCPQTTFPGPAKVYRPPVVKKVYVSPKPSISISNSGNTTITNNYYQQPQQAQPVVRETRPYGYYYSGGNDWLVPLLLLLLIGGLIAALIYTSQNHSNPPAVSTPVNITNNIPPAPKPTVVVPPSETEINNALNKAKENYGTFWRSSDGSYHVDFPKPKTEEKKPSEEKKD